MRCFSGRCRLRPGKVLTVGSTSSLDFFGSSLVSSYRDFVDVENRAASFEGLAAFSNVTVGFAAESIAIRHFAEGEGVLVADIRPKRVAPSEAIPAGRFWTPEGMDDDATFWHTSGAAGRTAYLKRRATREYARDTARRTGR